MTMHLTPGVSLLDAPSQLMGDNEVKLQEILKEKNMSLLQLFKAASRYSVSMNETVILYYDLERQ
jgi:hypothetical protein